MKIFETASSQLLTEQPPRAFDSLRAEREREWLHHVFVQPAWMDQIRGDKPVVIVGDDGAGKTALRLMLTKEAAEPAGHLVIEWELTAAMLEDQGIHALKQLQADLSRSCVRSLTRHLVTDGSAYSIAPDWMKTNVAELIAYHTELDRDRYFRQLRRTLSSDELLLLDSLLGLAADVSGYPSNSTTFDEFLSEYVYIAKSLRVQGVWIMIDGLEDWLELALDELRKRVQIFLSTLGLFETPGIAIKVFAPDELENSLRESGAVTRRRIADVIKVVWRDEELLSIVERRLAFHFGVEHITLAEIGDRETLLSLLCEYGGQKPLGWLLLMRPFVEAHANAPQHSLSERECLDLWRRNPPRLWMDAKKEQVYLGFRQLDALDPNPFRLLSYLYENRHRTCSYDELYYRGYRGYERIPDPSDEKRYEYPANWKHTWEMALSRLRKIIERDDRNPPYIVTERQRGVRLQNVT